MRISEAAKAAGVGVETVRFYERRGLIEQPGRPSGGGYRSYPQETVERIRFIREAREIGFSLGEIKTLLTLRVDPHADCGGVRAQVHAKLDEVRRKIIHLEEIKASLETLIDTCPGEGAALGECTIFDRLGRSKSST